MQIGCRWLLLYTAQRDLVVPVQVLSKTSAGKHTAASMPMPGLAASLAGRAADACQISIALRPVISLQEKGGTGLSTCDLRIGWTAHRGKVRKDY